MTRDHVGLLFVSHMRQLVMFFFSLSASAHFTHTIPHVECVLFAVYWDFCLLQSGWQRWRDDRHFEGQQPL